MEIKRGQTAVCAECSQTKPIDSEKFRCCRWCYLKNHLGYAGPCTMCGEQKKYGDIKEKICKRCLILKTTGKPFEIWNKGKAWPEEMRRKMSESHKGIPSPFKGISKTYNTGRTHFKKGCVSWNKGKSPSEETRLKISGSLKGKASANKGIKTGVPAWNRGIPHAEETKKKLSEIIKGQFDGGRPSWNEGKPMLPQVKAAVIKANWKGGRINHDGYIRIRCDGHPRATPHGHYVLEHILVMEKHIQRQLEPYEIVHHLNGNRADNHIENLELMTRSEHARLHNPKRGIGSVQACKTCGREKVLYSLKYSCCQGCYRIARETLKNHSVSS